MCNLVISLFYSFGFFLQTASLHVMRSTELVSSARCHKTILPITCTVSSVLNMPFPYVLITTANFQELYSKLCIIYIYHPNNNYPLYNITITIL